MVSEVVNDELALNRPIEVSFLPRSTAVMDEDLIRTKVSMIPESVPEIRVVDIFGLDKQADGGTHVHSTGEVGRIRVTKTGARHITDRTRFEDKLRITDPTKFAEAIRSGIGHGKAFGLGLLDIN